MALRFAELLGAAGLPENRPQLFPEQPGTDAGQIVIAPGGGFAEKRWPLENFAALAAALPALGLKSAVTTRKGLWRRDGSRYELPRLSVGRFDDSARLRLNLLG
jgi:hypothetical protein